MVPACGGARPSHLNVNYAQLVPPMPVLVKIPNFGSGGGVLPADDALQKPEISKNLDRRSTTYRDLIGDGSDAPGCVRRSRADALVPLGAI